MVILVVRKYGLINWNVLENILYIIYKDFEKCKF